MKRKRIFQTVITVLISAILVTETNIGFVYANNIVYVTDHGAKSFVEPVVCQLNGTSTIVATDGISNLSVGDVVRIANGAEDGDPGVDLIANIIVIDGNEIILDKVCGSEIITDVYIDSSQAFKDAFNYANSNNYDVVIPEGNYYVDSGVYIQTNVTCAGKIYTSNKGNAPLFKIEHKEGPLILPGTTISENLEAGTTDIPELAQYVNCDVIFDSNERIMWRNNNPGEFYVKEEINRIKSDGSLMVGLAESYNEPLRQIVLFQVESPITVEGLNILCIDDTITNYGKSIVVVERSDVTFNRLILDNENLSMEKGQNTGINVSYAVNVTLNNSMVRGFKLNGLGYGVIAWRTLYLTLNNTEVCETRHAVTGNGDNYTTINGGSYEGYGGSIDSHWGHKYTVSNATITSINGGVAFAYDGEGFTIDNCNITTDYPTLVYRRMDCPTIKGNVDIKNSTVTYKGTDSYFTFYSAKLTDFNHGAEIYNPNLIVDNVDLVLENSTPIVDIYNINHDANYEYTMQKLPETIRVKDLYITGMNDSKLRSTYFRMIAATNMYFTGNPEVYLENIIINRDTSPGSLNFDGEISYYLDPDNTVIPDTHYKIDVKNCGILSAYIIPTILGDMLIEDCDIIEYIYEGDLTNEWPNNPIWWHKGTGKTTFRNVKFDRTDLPASSIFIMNDVEFENCEFTNYGTIDYMDFGEQLPTVEIINVQNCIFNEGGITGGSLSEYLLPSNEEEYIFVIDDISINKETGITVQASVTPNTSQGGNAVVIFKLMEDNTVLGLYSGEQYIEDAMRFKIRFHGYSGEKYKVKVYVWDKLDDSVENIGVDLAAPIEIQ